MCRMEWLSSIIEQDYVQWTRGGQYDRRLLIALIEVEPSDEVAKWYTRPGRRLGNHQALGRETSVASFVYSSFLLLPRGAGSI
jgi:hypothetical protein